MIDTKYLRTSNDVGTPVTSTVTQNRTVGDNTLLVNDTENFPDYFIATIGDMKDGHYIAANNRTIVAGHLDSGKIIIDDFIDGTTDIGNAVGQNVVIKPTFAWSNGIADNMDDIRAHSGVGVDTVNSGKIYFSTASTQPAAKSDGIVVWFKEV